MAIKTDYYNRIIASLQSEITGLKTKVSELQKEMEGMRETMKKVTELKTSAKPITIEATPAVLSLKTLPRKEVEILISKMKTVCDEAIKANHENYLEMFSTRDDLAILWQSLNTTFLPIPIFRTYQEKQEIHLKSIGERLGSRFSLLTINRYISGEHLRRKGCFKLERLFQLLKEDGNHWIVSLLVSICIALMALYIFITICP